MHARRLSVLLLLALSVATTALAQKRVITPADLWAIKRLGSPVLSPDAKTVVFTQQEWSLEKNSEHHEPVARRRRHRRTLRRLTGGAGQRRLARVEPGRPPRRLHVEARRRRGRPRST